jgi:hypothetical protein
MAWRANTFAFRGLESGDDRSSAERVVIGPWICGNETRRGFTSVEFVTCRDRSSPVLSVKYCRTVIAMTECHSKPLGALPRQGMRAVCAHALIAEAPLSILARVMPVAPRRGGGIDRRRFERRGLLSAVVRQRLRDQYGVGRLIGRQVGAACHCIGVADA